METKVIAKNADKRNAAKPKFFILLDIPTIDQSSYKGSRVKPFESFPALDEIYWEDEKGNGRNRIIQYMPGEKSIFVDEQSETNQKLTDPQVARKRGNIHFIEGVKAVDPREVLLMQFLDLCNANLSNTKRMPGKTALFKELRNDHDSEKVLDKEYMMADVILKVRTMKIYTLKAYARVLKINVDREASEIRHDMVQRAKADPIVFIKRLDDPLMEKQFFILEAIELGILTKKDHSNTISWANGEMVVKGRPNQDCIEAMAEYCDGDEDGKMIYRELVKRVSPYLDEKAELVVSGPASSSSTSSDPVKTEDEKFLDLTIEKGVITQSGPFYLFRGMDGKDAKEKGKKAILDLFKNDVSFQDFIRQQL